MLIALATLALAGDPTVGGPSAGGWSWGSASTDPAIAIDIRTEPAPAEFRGVPTAGGATVTYLQGRMAQVSFFVPQARTDDLLKALGGEPGGVTVHFTTDREELWVVRREGGTLVVATSREELDRCRELLAACPLVGPQAPPAEVDDVQAVNDALSRQEELHALGQERARLEAAVTVSCRGAMFPSACRRARADLAAFDAAHPDLL